MSAQFFYVFVSSIPIWVFPLFAVLLVLGLRSSRERVIPVKLFWFLPLIGLISLPGLLFTGRAEASAVFLLAYALGAWFGRTFQDRIVLELNGAMVRVRGEWLTLVTMMVLFFANFLKGAVAGMAPDLAGSLHFILPVVCVSAFSSGTFLGRSLHVIGLSRDTSHPTAPLFGDKN